MSKRRQQAAHMLLTSGYGVHDDHVDHGVRPRTQIWFSNRSISSAEKLGAHRVMVLRLMCSVPMSRLVSIRSEPIINEEPMVQSHWTNVNDFVIKCIYARGTH